MRIYLFVTSIIAELSNILLLVVFVRGLKKYVDDIAWKLIMTGFVFVFINNSIIAYLIIARPKGKFATFLALAFFAIKAIKGVSWLIGFYLLNRYFVMLETLPDSYFRRQKIDSGKVVLDEFTGN